MRPIVREPELPRGPKAFFARASEGACVGMDTALFFPGRGESCGPAKAVCAGCVVREECGEFALAAGIREGIFGGLSERERRKVRRERGSRSAA